MTAAAADIITTIIVIAETSTHMTADAAATSTHTAEWMPLKREMTMCTLHRDS